MICSALERSARYAGICDVLRRSHAPRYRASQILRSVYQTKVPSYLDMLHIPRQLRENLHEHFDGSLLSLKACSTHKSDRACKILFEYRDGSKVEAVLLSFPTHKSLCISSQVGCAYACSFCATGRIGLKRNLSVDEITDQVLYFQQLGHEIDSISFMGMGEPLSNPNVFRAMRVLSDRQLFGTSSRRINISTVGILPGIKKLNRDHPKVNLAFSMHSPFTDQRNKLVPANNVYPFQEVFGLLDERIRLTGKRVWVSYVLMKGENDTVAHAEELVKLIKKRPEELQYLYHVNLIPYNTARSIGVYERTEETDIDKFKGVLKKSKISYSFRNHFGQSIDAACGQLFADYDPADQSQLFGHRRKVNTS
ncbi:radical SAM domain containing protein, putative [Babesia bigemina]|uniref:Radical SAM domain containing protein, putative n=1 Tax=Babesia bigemina TaxID=5866 RepID=A0A061DA01_BABBI|nr:radical SAM domain containing protein, putative [Babesia bigemina]CDR97338.1 radical SAM domain containing protein, putative [Babesia bigemina]|eukprot:XP_012769524.1 radical SAM domain containing protein, putative [Babesia bigemina]